MKIKLTTLASTLALAFSLNAGADTLLEVYEVAKVKDPAILKSYAQYQRYLEGISETRADLLPQINFTMQAGYTEGLQTSSKTTKNKKDLSNTNGLAKLGLTQSLYNGTYWQNTDIADRQATEYKAVYGYNAQELIMRTADAYFSVLRADEAVKSVAANKRAVERQLEQTKQRFDVGLIAITDVHEAQAEYDRTVADEIMAENKLVNSYYTLRELTGHDVLKVNYLNTETFAPEALEGSVKVWRNKALEHNLSLHSKRIAKDIAKMQIDLAQTGHGPTLDFLADVTSNTNNYVEDVSPFGPHSDSSSANVALRLNVPIYTGGGITSRVKQAQYGYVIASEDLVLNFRQTEAQVNSGYNNVRASISSIKAYEQTVKSSRSALKATEAGFEVGTRTVVDVLDATRSLYASENQLANARYDYILAMLQLKLDAGTLAEQDIIDISNTLVEVAPDVEDKNNKKN